MRAPSKKRPRPRNNPIIAPATSSVLVRNHDAQEASKSPVWDGDANIYGAGLLSKSPVWVERANFYGDRTHKSDFIVIGFDTEFKSPSGPVSREVLQTGFAKYEILSYQVYVKAYKDGLPLDGEWGGICFPQPDKRLTLGTVIAFAIQGAIRAKAIQKVPSDIYLTGHFTRADIPAFDDFKDMVQMADAIRGSFVTVGYSIPLDFDFEDGGPRAELNVHLRDTILLTATQSKALWALGEVVGEPKVVLDPDPAKEQHWKENIDRLLVEKPDLFDRYALTDAKICVRYMDQLLTQVRELTGEVTPPLTLTAIGVDLLMNSWEKAGLNAESVLGMVRIKDRKYDKRRGYYITTSRNVPIEPVHFHVGLATEAYHGGRNEQFWSGPCFEDAWTDWDLSGAYPTAMSLIRMPDWERIKVCNDVNAFTPATLGVANVEFTFPAKTRFPCLPVRTANGLIFPLRGVSNCAAPEIAAAVAIGAHVRIRHGVIVPWANDTRIFGDFIEGCVAKRKSYKKGTLPELLWKELTNATYGKTAQGLHKKRVYDLQARDTKPLPPSKITNPFFAAYITSYVRALLGEIMNALPPSVCVFSCTTDGFLTSATEAQIEAASQGQLSQLFRQSREDLTGVPDHLERKHACRQLIGWRTRGQATWTPGDKVDGGDYNFVLAKGGIHVPEPYDTVEARNAWIIDLYLNRTPQSKIEMNVLTGIRDIVEYGADLVSKEANKRLNMEFDWKRRPYAVRMAAAPAHVAFSTQPWNSVEEFQTVREVWDDYSAKSVVCIKTADDYGNFACQVLARTTLGDNAAWMKKVQGDLKRLRQGLGSAWKHSKAGLTWRQGGLSNEAFAKVLVEAGVPCRRTDVENDAKKVFEPHRCPATPAVEAALYRLKQRFPTLEREAFVSDRRTGIDLVSALEQECPFIARV
jgi:hypothetical protein